MTLKLENILARITDDDIYIKIIDFGGSLFNPNVSVYIFKSFNNLKI